MPISVLFLFLFLCLQALAASKTENKVLQHEKNQSAAMAQLLRSENEEMKKLWDADLRSLVKLKKRVKELEAQVLEGREEAPAVPEAAPSPPALSEAPAPLPLQQPKKQAVRLFPLRKGPCLACDGLPEGKFVLVPVVLSSESDWHSRCAWLPCLLHGHALQKGRKKKSEAPTLPPPNGDDVYALRANLPPLHLQRVGEEEVVAELRVRVFNRPSIRERFMSGEIRDFFESENPRESELYGPAMDPPAVHEYYGSSGPALGAPVSRSPCCWTSPKAPG